MAYPLEGENFNRRDVDTTVPDAWFGLPCSAFQVPRTCGSIEFKSDFMFPDLLDPCNQFKSDSMFLDLFDTFNPLIDASVDTNTAKKRAKQVYARPDQWGPVRPIITELYSKLPLHSVIKEMEQRGFFASEKMYKYRIERWGLNKKLKAREVDELLERRERCRASGNTIDTPVVWRGKPVNWQRVERYVKRNKKATLLESSLPLPRLTKLDPPDEHRLYGTLSLAFEQYVTGSIRPGGWSIPDGKGVLLGRHGVPGLESLIAWVDGISEAATLIRRKKIDQGFIILNACLDEANRKFRDEDPRLHQELLGIVVRLRKQDPKIADRVANFFRKLALTVFPSRHPIALFWQRWDRIRAHSLVEIFRATIQPFARGFDDVTAAGSWEFACFVRNYFYTLSLCSGGATSELRNIEHELRDHLDKMKNRLSDDHVCMIYLRLQLADTLSSLGDYVGARTILDQTADWLEKQDELDSSDIILDIWTDWYYAMIGLFKVNEEWQRGYEFCRDWCHMLVWKYGKQHHLVAYCHADLVDFSRKLPADEIKKWDAAYEEVASEFAKLWVGPAGGSAVVTASC